MIARGLYVLPFALFSMAFSACRKNDAPPEATEASGRGDGSASAVALASRGVPSLEQSTGDVALLVVKDLASPAFGGRKIDTSCVALSKVVESSDGPVVTARVRRDGPCSEAAAGADELFVFVRRAGKWNEEFMGPPPKCWRGGPPELAPAIASASDIPVCPMTEEERRHSDGRRPGLAGQPVVVKSASDLPGLVGQIVTIEGVPTRAKQPTLLGVDVDVDSLPAGAPARSTGILRRFVVTVDPNEAARKNGGPMVAARGVGTYYLLEDPKTGNPAKIEVVQP